MDVKSPEQEKPEGKKSEFPFGPSLLKKRSEESKDENSNNNNNNNNNTAHPTKKNRLFPIFKPKSEKGEKNSKRHLKFI